MLIRTGYDLTYTFPKPTPLILTVHIHYSRASDLVRPDYLTTDPVVSATSYHDGFGNSCTRLVAPQGKLRLSTDALVQDAGMADPQNPNAYQHAVQDLPEETLVFLLGSRYCETDRLSEIAWSLFSQGPSGWARVQAICNFVHSHVQFGYQHANPTKTALEVYNDRHGVCRDFAHLAIAFCRCMNIPARYCTGYLADIGVPATEGDFAGWFEAYLDGRWHTFDPRNNKPRIGRILMARGRDAADVAISTAFGANTLESFKVWTEQVEWNSSAASEPAASVIAATKQWLERAVIGLQLCPFAASAANQGRVRYVVSEQDSNEGLIADLTDELLKLNAADPTVCETTLLIHPQVLTDFLTYNDFLDESDRTLVSLGLEGDLQIASFHPDYQFAGTAVDDIENFTNRSPYPMLHLLREDSITRVANLPGVDDIGRNNIATLRQLGLAGWKQLWVEQDETGHS